MGKLLQSVEVIYVYLFYFPLACMNQSAKCIGFQVISGQLIRVKFGPVFLDNNEAQLTAEIMLNPKRASILITICVTPLRARVLLGGGDLRPHRQEDLDSKALGTPFEPRKLSVDPVVDGLGILLVGSLKRILRIQSKLLESPVNQTLAQGDCKSIFNECLDHRDRPHRECRPHLHGVLHRDDVVEPKKLRPSSFGFLPPRLRASKACNPPFECIANLS